MLMQRKLLFWSVWLSVIGCCISPAGQAEESQVVVSATGRVSVKPDMAKFDVVVKSDAKTADKAATDTAEKYRAVQKSLRTEGISLDDSPTASYTVAPRSEWDQSLGKSILKGYTARHVISVKVRILEKIGRAIDAVVGAGADEVQSITFSSSQYDMLRQEALVAAVENARRDAGVMAKAAGGRIGQLMEVSVNQPSYRDHPQMDVMAMRAAPSAISTEIAPKEQDIMVTISSRWRFVAPSLK